MAAKKKSKAGKAFATLDKKIPEGHFAFVVGNEVRITKRNTKGRPKGAKNKRQGCERPKAKRTAKNKAGGRRATTNEKIMERAYQSSAEPTHKRTRALGVPLKKPRKPRKANKAGGKSRSFTMGDRVQMRDDFGRLVYGNVSDTSALSAGYLYVLWDGNRRVSKTPLGFGVTHAPYSTSGR